MNDSTVKEERITIPHIINQIAQQQQQQALWISTLTSSIESIRLEIRRTDENHTREVDRLHDIIKILLQPKQTGVIRTPQEVYNESDTPAAFFGKNAAQGSVNNRIHPQQRAQMPIATSEAISQPPRFYRQVKAEPENFDSKDDISSDSSDGEPWENPNESNKTSDSVIVANSDDFGSKYIKKDNEWTCNDCYTVNAATVDECVCCKGSNQPTSTGQKSSLPPSIIPITSAVPSKFSFGLNAEKASSPKPAVSGEKPRVSFADAAKETAEKAPSPSISRSSNDTSKFTFGAKALSSGSIFGGNKNEVKPFTFKAESISSPKTGQATDRPITKSLFGASANKTLDDSQSGQPSPKIFGSSSSTGTPTLDKFDVSGTSLFDDEAKKQAQNELAKQKSSKFGASVFNQDDEGSAEEYEPTAEFTPVCPLPDLIEVVTGEEDEKILYKGRCKLYRFVKDTKEWKERGVGEIKLLLNETTGKSRCVMRRDQTLKLACNFPLGSGMSINKMPKNEKAVMWLCVDFSEGQNPEKFSARFADAEKADEFARYFAENCK